jgi:hypothetical protein
MLPKSSASSGIPMTVVLFSRPRCCKLWLTGSKGNKFSDWVRDAGKLNDLAYARDEQRPTA